jgi:hypothetical protein
MTDYSIVSADRTEDAYADSDVPGEFLTMRFGDEVESVGPGTAVRVAPQTVRSHRNQGDEPVEMWAVSPLNDSDSGEKVEDFWEASPQAAQHE